MKICIVTVYNGSNYGARLQALALKHVLEQRGHKVVHLETGARNPRKIAVKKVIKRLVTFDWRKESLAFQWNRGNVFVKEAKEFCTCDKDEAGQADMVIFGSDEIWNVKRKMIFRYPMLFGKNIDNSCKASYAVSINDAGEEDFKRHPFSIEEISKFNKITVRDDYSKHILQNLLPGREITVVVDPTLLPERKYYEDILENPVLEPYILVYSYGVHLGKDSIKEMSEYAKRHQLKLVSVLGYLPWCDYNIPYSTKEVLGLFQNAEYIFTDTYHGALFSMIFEKQFLIVSAGTKKLNSLLEKFHLQGRKTDFSDREIEESTCDELDYQECRKRISESRAYSLKELDAILNMKKSV